jgi:hypothetical protein
MRSDLHSYDGAGGLGKLSRLSCNPCIGKTTVLSCFQVALSIYRHTFTCNQYLRVVPNQSNSQQLQRGNSRRNLHL